MIRSMCAVCVLLLVYSTAGATADKSGESKGQAKSSQQESTYGVDKQKSKGRPDNPGQHGRENAAAKQRENPGKGSKGDESWEDTARGARDNDNRDDDERGDRDRDEDRDQDRDDNQGRDKDEKKQKNKEKDKEKQEGDDD